MTPDVSERTLLTDDGRTRTSTVGSGKHRSSSAHHRRHSHHSHSHREGPKITVLRMALIGFVFTCSGPYGVEAAVRVAGPLLTLIGLFSVPFLYVVPQILVVSEMSTMMPSNHGNLLWVQRAFGPTSGFYNGWNTLLTNMIDITTYPVLFGNYLMARFNPSGPFWMKYALRASCIIGGALVACLPAARIGDLSGFVTALVMIPFFIGFFHELPHMEPSNWTAVPSSPDLGVLSSTLLWMYTGWTSLGSLAGEVKNHRVIFTGLSITIVLDVICYAAPLLAALDYPGDWADGYLVSVYDKILPGIGNVIAVGVAVSTFGVYISGMICYSRVLWGFADMGWAPRIFAKRFKGGAPVVAVFSHAVVALGLAATDFSFLVQVEFVLSSAAYILVFTAFLRLRYTEPNTPRPFIVPGGMTVAWIITVSKVAVMVVVFFTNIFNLKIALGFAIFNIFVFVLYELFKANATVPETPMHGVPGEGDASKRDYMSLRSSTVFPVSDTHPPAPGRTVTIDGETFMSDEEEEEEEAASDDCEEWEVGPRCSLQMMRHSLRTGSRMDDSETNTPITSERGTPVVNRYPQRSPSRVASSHGERTTSFTLPPAAASTDETTDGAHRVALGNRTGAMDSEDSRRGLTWTDS